MTHFFWEATLNCHALLREPENYAQDTGKAHLRRPQPVIMRHAELQSGLFHHLIDASQSDFRVHRVIAKSVGQTIHFTQAGLMFPIVCYLQERGVPIEKYLREAGITPELIESPTTPFPRNLFFRFMNAACEEEGIEDIGLLVGQTTSLQMMGEFGELLLDAKNIDGYLRKGCELISTASTGEYYWLEDKHKQVRFCASYSKLDDKDTIQADIYLMLTTINTISTSIGEVWQPTDLVIPGVNPVTSSKLAKTLPKTKIICEGTHSSFPVQSDILARQILTRREPVHTIDTALPSNFLASIAQLVKTLLLSGIPDIHSTADAAGISPRTLQRNLEKHDSSFTQMLVQVRIQLAKQWIRDGRQSLSEIAHALGYSDVTNFSRAFRRHTGQSPSNYRKDRG